MAGSQSQAPQPQVIRPVTLLELAELDLDKIIDWYDCQLPGLGVSLFWDVDQTLKQVERFPESYAVYSGPIRRTHPSLSDKATSLL